MLGKNGAGKSSILKAVLGLLRPATGKATVLGFDAAREPVALRDRVGYMPEKDAAIPGLTGLEMVILAGQLSGLPAADAKQRAHEVLYLVGLDEPRYRPVATYSLGMKQKAKLATALVHDPDLIFLDEPTNGLDPGGRKEVLALLSDLVRKKGKSLILSSHILSDVEALCENVVLIDGGRVLSQGPVADLTRSSGTSFVVRARGEVAKFEQLLREQGFLRDVLEDATFDLHLAAGQTPQAVFEIARSQGAQIRLLERKRRSLSDVFLDAVSRGAAESPAAGSPAAGSPAAD